MEGQVQLEKIWGKSARGSWGPGSGVVLAGRGTKVGLGLGCGLGAGGMEDPRERMLGNGRGGDGKGPAMPGE